ncbi:MAG: hypothetical protein ACR2N3_09855, partial [Pyrinomonadaceae bacterium]
KFLRITICLGLLVGIVCSHEAWFPVYRSFPRVPFVFALPENFVLLYEWLFSSILVISLILIIFSRRPKIFLAVVISSLVLLAFFDYLRLQPWTYQYLLILAVFYWHDWETDGKSAGNQTLGLVQIIIAGLYIWSGVQKMNFTFSRELLPNLLMPLQNLFPSIHLPFQFLGIAIPLTESLIGCGLLFRGTRNLAVCLAVLMHSFVLTLLIVRDYNSIIWVWNFTLIFAVVFAFWRNPVSLRKTITSGKFTFVKLIVFAGVLLPILSFFGWWDMFLSGALYSGNVEIPVIRINENVFEKLPPTAKSTVFQTKSGQQMLPLFEWSIADTNAPVYLEQRVFRQAAFEVCKLADDKNQVELIIRERPSILDGNYKVIRNSCAELENH